MLLASAILFYPVSGHSQDLSNCEAKSPRQSVIYIDDTNLVKSDSIWSLTIAFKLTASLMPGEKLTIVQMLPTIGETKQLWQSCWPKIENDPHSIDMLKKQISFSQQINDTLTSLLAKVGSDQKYNIDITHPPQKQIIKSLITDIARYKNTDEPTIRAIIYSNMAENSNLGSAFSASTNSVYTNTLGIYFTHGVFYGFGLGKGINDVNYNVNAIRFWNNFFKAVGAIPENISSEFAIPPTPPKSGLYFNVTLHYEKETLPGKLALMVDKDNNLIDSWIGISHLSGSGLKGKLTCKDDSICKLDAVTEGGLVGYSDHEDVQLVIVPNSSVYGFDRVDNVGQFYIDGKSADR